MFKKTRINNFTCFFVTFAIISFLVVSIVLAEIALMLFLTSISFDLICLFLEKRQKELLTFYLSKLEQIDLNQPDERKLLTPILIEIERYVHFNFSIDRTIGSLGLSSPRVDKKIIHTWENKLYSLPPDVAMVQLHKIALLKQDLDIEPYAFYQKMIGVSVELEKIAKDNEFYINLKKRYYESNFKKVLDFVVTNGIKELFKIIISALGGIGLIALFLILTGHTVDISTIFAAWANITTITNG
ncbi:MAG: hypothetical protein WCW13_01540 [archaeon]